MRTRPSALLLPEAAAPHIVTELPGPRARALIATGPRHGQPIPHPRLPARGEIGQRLCRGRRRRQPVPRLRRRASRSSPPATAHPKVVEAIKEQADRLIHIAATDFYEPRYLELSEHLASIAPFSRGRRASSSPTRAPRRSKGAIKLARYHTHRPGHDRVRGCLPRPHHGRPLADQLEDPPAGGLRAAAADGLARALPAGADLARALRWGRQRGARGAAPCDPGPNHGAQRRGGHRGRAGPGRGWLLPGARDVPGGAARDLRRARHPADRRRDPVRHGTDRAMVGDAARRRRAGHRDRRQGDRVGDANRRIPGARIGHGPGSPAPTARPSAGTRCAPQLAWPPSNCSRTV